MQIGHRTLRGVGALGALIVFLLFLVLLGILWASTGGPERGLSHSGPFLKPPTAPGVQLNDGEVKGVSSQEDGTTIREVAVETDSLLNYFFNNPNGGTNVADSPYASDIEIRSGNADVGNPNEEYIIIETSRNLARNITITGWILESRTTGVKAPIGSAAQIFMLGGVSSELPITVGPESAVYVTTGRSPNGASFRINKCSGYLEQFQDFEPNLDVDCPNPADEALQNPQKTGTNAACIDFIENVNSCELYSDTIPYEVGTQCRDFILNDLSYNGCVTRHRNDPDFYVSEWRIFLNRQQELWNNTHEQIRLLDENGKLVGSVTY